MRGGAVVWAELDDGAVAEAGTFAEGWGSFCVSALLVEPVEVVVTYRLRTRRL